MKRIAMMLMLTVTLIATGCSTLKSSETQSVNLQTHINDFLSSNESGVANMGVSLNNLQMSAADEGKTDIKSNIKLSIMGFSAEALANVQGRLEFDNVKKAFFIREPDLLSLKVKDIPHEMMMPIKFGMETMLLRTLSNSPIYVLQDKTKTVTDFSVDGNALNMKLVEDKNAPAASASTEKNKASQVIDEATDEKQEWDF